MKKCEKKNTPLDKKKSISHLSQAQYYRIDIKKKLIFNLLLTCGFNFQYKISSWEWGKDAKLGNQARRQKTIEKYSWL